MNSRIISILGFLAIAVIQVKAQDEGRTYLDGALASTAKKNAKYYLVNEGKRSELFIGRLYTIEGKLRSEGTFADPALKVEHGQFIFYHTNGQVESKGEFVMGNKSGVWERFDPAGKRLAEKVYDHKPLENIVFTMAETMPRHGHGSDREFVKYIKQKVDLPKGKRFKGEMMASFIVEKNGMLSDVKIVKGEDGSVNQQVVEAIKASAPWDPGSEKGQPVRVAMRMPVEF